MKTTSKIDNNLFDRYYLNQAGGGGGVDVFKGVRVQKGHGLGGLFRGIIKSAMPLLKSGIKSAKPMLKSGVKVLGKHMLDMGMNLAEDLMEGQSFKSAVKRRSSQAGKKLKRKALQTIAKRPPGKRMKRQKHHNDIFDE